MKSGQGKKEGLTPKLLGSERLGKILAIVFDKSVDVDISQRAARQSLGHLGRSISTRRKHLSQCRKDIGEKSVSLYQQFCTELCSSLSLLLDPLLHHGMIALRLLSQLIHLHFQRRTPVSLFVEKLAPFSVHDPLLQTRLWHRRFPFTSAFFSRLLCCLFRTPQLTLCISLALQVQKFGFQPFSARHILQPLHLVVTH